MAVEVKCVGLTRDGQLALTLQESRIGGDELLRLRHKPISIIPSSEVLRPPRACSSQCRSIAKGLPDGRPIAVCLFSLLVIV